jgi:hypothetical protein|tara:strand:+ start:7724 stop:10312 length:2589 start_codon:yes stop_codon:yes gene_type:complete
MPKAAAALTPFTAGELSPRLDGRVDLQKYFSGAKVLQNMVVHPHGGASRRPGTIFVAEVKTSSEAARLIPFEFNVTQTYVLQFGPSYFRILKDGGVIESGGSPVEVATSYTEAELPELKFAQSADVMYVVHPDHPPRKISRTSHTAWTIANVTLVRGPMQDENLTTTTLTAGARTGSVTITASSATFASTDVGRLVKLHNGYAAITAYSSATSVTATVQENEDLRSELQPSYTASTIALHEGDPSATGLEHNDRITDSGKNFIDEGFKTGMNITVAGAGTGANNGSYLAVSVTEDTILLAPSDDVTAEAASSSITISGDLTAHTEWSLGALSATTGYPSAVSLYEQRLVFAATANQPQTLFFSVSGDFENFTSGTADADAMIYTIGSNQVNVIRYLASGRSLLVGTSGGEFAARAGDSDAAITPTNIQIKRQCTYGTADIQPVQVANATLFVQRAKRKLRELTYNFDTDSYTAPDLTILAEHITETGISEVSYQQEPDNIIWCVLANGKLAGMTYRREESVVAWHQHKIGGVFGAATVTVTDYANIDTGTDIILSKSDGTTVTFTSEAAGGSAPTEDNGWRPNGSNDATADNIFTAINAHDDFTVANPAANVVTIYETLKTGTDPLTVTSTDLTRLAVASESYAVVENIAVTPGDLDEDAIYIVVKRTINGATKRYIEYFNVFDFGSNVENAFFVDSGLSYSGSASSSISGLSHLEGEAITILTNGSTHPNKPVASGAVTLDRTTTYGHFGLGFTSTLQTMRIDQGSAQGTSQGKTKRIHDVTVRLYRSVGVKVGQSSAQLDLIPFRSSADEMGLPVPLYTGDKDVEFDGGYDTDGFVVVRQDQALPLTVLAVYPRLTTFDE